MISTIRIILLAAALMALSACSSTPRVVAPPARAQAELHHRNALLAQEASRLATARFEWQQAVLAYQSIDDAAGQGMARLGLAQTLLRLNLLPEAEQVLQPMLAEDDAYSLFLPAQRAQAALQMAQLLQNRDAAQALQWVERSRSWCAQPCGIAAQQANLQAKIVLKNGDIAGAQAHIDAALSSAGSDAERAFSQRLQAEIALLQQDFSRALALIDAVIVVDQRYAEPLWLLDDYRLLLRLAQQSQDAALQARAEQHLAALCAALKDADCKA